MSVSSSTKHFTTHTKSDSTGKAYPSISTKPDVMPAVTPMKILNIF